MFWSGVVAAESWYSEVLLHVAVFIHPPPYQSSLLVSNDLLPSPSALSLVRTFRIVLLLPLLSLFFDLIDSPVPLLSGPFSAVSTATAKACGLLVADFLRMTNPPSLSDES